MTPMDLATGPVTPIATYVPSFEDQGAQQKIRSLEQTGSKEIHPNTQIHLCPLGRRSQLYGAMVLWGI